MILFYSTLVFVLGMIALILSLATVTKNKIKADVTMKLHIFLVQAVVVFSVIVIVCSGYVALRALLGC